MIQLTTVLNVADNSGARKLFCIQVMGGSKRKWGTIGDVIVASVREAIPNSNIAKGSVVKAVIVRTRKEVRRRDGSYVRFDDNAAVIIDANVLLDAVGKGRCAGRWNPPAHRPRNTDGGNGVTVRFTPSCPHP